MNWLMTYAKTWGVRKIGLVWQDISRGHSVIDVLASIIIITGCHSLIKHIHGITTLGWGFLSQSKPKGPSGNQDNKGPINPSENVWLDDIENPINRIDGTMDKVSDPVASYQRYQSIHSCPAWCRHNRVSMERGCQLRREMFIPLPA